MDKRFADRAEAGRLLAQELAARAWAGPCVVLALPRGGVPIGAAVARALKAPLDLLLVRKIGAPWQPELAVAAVVDGTPPQLVIDEGISASVGADRAYIERCVPEQVREIERRRAVYLRGREPVDVEGATAIVVDDGIATGTTVRAALRALRLRRPKRLVLAVPVAPEDAVASLRAEVDEVVCLRTPANFHAIGLHYADFHQVGDDEVVAELDALGKPAAAAPARG
ncbi:MAG: phosphoribosyltransferase [Leptothrix sp. (in: Bacteria)]|nr:phosphoribosyltransferase [Leptothrix sp. (in: b-proteobacteria)]